jgi:hypothetical protein
MFYNSGIDFKHEDTLFHPLEGLMEPLEISDASVNSISTPEDGEFYVDVVAYNEPGSFDVFVERSLISSDEIDDEPTELYELSLELQAFVGAALNAIA